jgi:hypothetical protein
MIQEIFALPVALTQVTEIDGIPLYGSQTLNDKFIQSIKLSKRGRNISKSIEQLVNKKIIIPCFADSGMLKYFRRRISQDTSGGLLRILRFLVAGKKPIEHPLDFCLAFYNFKTNQIIILISNHITERFSLTASNESLALALTHESMHMYAHQKPNKFLSFFKDELNLYYKTYFTEIFKLKDDKNLEMSIESIYRYLFLRCEMIDEISLTAIYKQLQKLKQYSEMNDHEFKVRSIEYIRVIRLLLTVDMITFLSIVKIKYSHLIKPLYQTYKTSFGKLPQKGCVQELVYPSEVICGFSDIKLTPKIKTAIQSLI